MRLKYLILILVTGIFMLSCSNLKNEKLSPKVYSPDWESLKTHKTPDWFLDGKFGIYFHWGPYSVPAYKTEWYPRNMYIAGHRSGVNEHHVKKYGKDFQYHEFIPDFTGEHFNADEWAGLIKASGARYAGPAAEHHDHFSMWDSKVNPWNSVRMGPKKDIVGELEKAIKGRGLKFLTTLHLHYGWGYFPQWTGNVDTSTVELRSFYGDYVSPLEFDSCGANPEKYGPPCEVIDIWNKKILEVIDGYKPDMLWFDGRLKIMPDKDRQKFIAHFYNQAAKEGRSVVLNYKNDDLPTGVGVIDMERGRLNEIVDYPWLTDDSWTWKGWAYSPDHEYKTANNVIDGLIDIVSKNGCLLLNIGPKSDGTIPDEIKKGMLEVGAWLNENGEAIYGTRPFVVYGEGSTKLVENHFGGVNDRGIQFTPDDVRFTTKDKYLYILQLGTPQLGQEIVLKSFAQGSTAGKVKIKSIELIGSSEQIKWDKQTDGLHITTPAPIPNTIALVYKTLLEQ